LFGELSSGLFILCLGLAILHSSVWIVVGFSAAIAGFISQIRANRRYAAQREAFRHKNAPNYPRIFDTPPPEDIDGAAEEEFDLYDTDTCTYLGKTSRKDLKILIHRFREIPQQGPNDIFMLVESLEMLPNDSISPEFSRLLRDAFKKQDSLVLRWIPSNRQN